MPGEVVELNRLGLGVTPGTEPGVFLGVIGEKHGLSEQDSPEGEVDLPVLLQHDQPTSPNEKADLLLGVLACPPHLNTISNSKINSTPCSTPRPPGTPTYSSRPPPRAGSLPLSSSSPQTAGSSEPIPLTYQPPPPAVPPWPLCKALQDLIKLVRRPPPCSSQHFPPPSACPLRSPSSACLAPPRKL